MNQVINKVISKSAKRKMSSTFMAFTTSAGGDQVPEKIIRPKAGTFTQMVVYHYPMGKGKYRSITKHERTP